MIDKNLIIEKLKSISSEKYKNNIIKLGIPAEHSIGVPTGDIRKIAKEIGKSQDLAMELWKSGYHEAKLLAVLIMEKNKVSITDVEMLMENVISWDLCDHLCKNLVAMLPNYHQLIFKWNHVERIYYKRASYCLMATSVMREKELSLEEIDHYLDIIKQTSDDDRIHVKKAISWALREIGKRNFECLDRAIVVAYDLKESTNKNTSWIGKDAIKELETLVSVDGRNRLISSNSAMGKIQ